MKHQQGFSLIEVLIALVVLAFGLMGVAAMQIKALQSATEMHLIHDGDRLGLPPVMDVFPDVRLNRAAYL